MPTTHACPCLLYRYNHLASFPHFAFFRPNAHHQNRLTLLYHISNWRSSRAASHRYHTAAPPTEGPTGQGRIRVRFLVSCFGRQQNPLQLPLIMGRESIPVGMARRAGSLLDRVTRIAGRSCIQPLGLAHGSRRGVSLPTFVRGGSPHLPVCAPPSQPPSA